MWSEPRIGIFSKTFSSAVDSDPPEGSLFCYNFISWHTDDMDASWAQKVRPSA